MSFAKSIVFSAGGSITSGPATLDSNLILLENYPRQIRLGSGSAPHHFSASFFA
jgi:hypothetical protein